MLIFQEINIFILDFLEINIIYIEFFASPKFNIFYK